MADDLTDLFGEEDFDQIDVGTGGGGGGLEQIVTDSSAGLNPLTDANQRIIPQESTGDRILRSIGLLGAGIGDIGALKAGRPDPKALESRLQQTIQRDALRQRLAVQSRRLQLEDARFRQAQAKQDRVFRFKEREELRDISQRGIDAEDGGLSELNKLPYLTKEAAKRRADANKASAQTQRQALYREISGITESPLEEVTKSFQDMPLPELRKRSDEIREFDFKDRMQEKKDLAADLRAQRKVEAKDQRNDFQKKIDEVLRTFPSLTRQEALLMVGGDKRFNPDPAGGGIWRTNADGSATFIPVGSSARAGAGQVGPTAAPRQAGLGGIPDRLPGLEGAPQAGAQGRSAQLLGRKSPPLKRNSIQRPTSVQTALVAGATGIAGFWNAAIRDAILSQISPKFQSNVGLHRQILAGFRVRLQEMFTKHGRIISKQFNDVKKLAPSLGATESIVTSFHKVRALHLAFNQMEASANERRFASGVTRKGRQEAESLISDIKVLRKSLGDPSQLPNEKDLGSGTDELFRSIGETFGLVNPEIGGRVRGISTPGIGGPGSAEAAPKPDEHGVTVHSATEVP